MRTKHQNNYLSVFIYIDMQNLQLYALAIEFDFIHFKCPFVSKPGIHEIDNDGNLRSRKVKLVDVDCPHCDQCTLHITNATERIRMIPNKHKTSYLRLRCSKQRQGRIHHKQMQEDDKELDEKKNAVLVRF